MCVVESACENNDERRREGEDKYIQWREFM